MKQTGKWMMWALIIFALAATPVSAMANGEGQSFKNSCQVQSRAAKGLPAGPCLLIANGDPITVSGTVYEVRHGGQGLIVDTGQELVTIFGMGPQWYWNLLGVDKPDVGEALEIQAVQIRFSDGTEKVIAISITMGEDVVPLRDENGRPLWRSKGRNT